MRDILLTMSWRPKIIRTASLPPSTLQQWRGMLSGTGALYPSLRRVPHIPRHTSPYHSFVGILSVLYD